MKTGMHELLIQTHKDNHDFMLALYRALDDKNFNKEVARQLLKDRMQVTLSVIKEAEQ